MSLRTVWRSLVAGRDEVEADEERVHAARVGTQAVADVDERTSVLVSGVLRSVILRPSEKVRVVEAELYDGSGSIELRWLGRRRIPGVEPGRRVRVRGLVTVVDGRRVIYNPRYELVANADAQL
ncbi:OB-fold nucleic acid binding domain-containing protein [Sanguibacter sp. A247]|uniref:OB-fold nucleic acid binding domain-containing protein n=1 Tax=unclassified Sanguibacter TaxID=2645534 RepID=UPI003FD75D49